MVSKNPPPAGSDFGLRPSQGQSRFLDPIHFPTYLSNIFRARFLLFYISIIFHKGPEKGNKRAEKGIYFFPYFMLKLGEKYSDRGKVV